MEPVEVEGEHGMMKKPKMRIVLSRAPNFKQLMEKTAALKKENETAYDLIYAKKP